MSYSHQPGNCTYTKMQVQKRSNFKRYGVWPWGKRKLLYYIEKKTFKGNEKLCHLTVLLMFRNPALPGCIKPVVNSGINYLNW